MKFIHCLLSTFLGFAAIYFGSLDFGSINNFDSGSRRPLSPERSQGRSTKMMIVRNPVTKSRSNPSDAESIAQQNNPEPHKQAQPNPTESTVAGTLEPPGSASEEVTPRDGTHGSATTSLEVVIRGVRSDDQLQRLLLAEGCKIIAVKVEEKKVVEAFLPDRFNNFVMASGKHGTGEFESFRRLHPTNQFVWFRWHDLESGIGSIACTELERFRVKPDGYFIYLILSRELSAEVQRLLSHKAFEEQIALQDIVYAKILLDTDGLKFRTEVLQVELRPDIEDAAESDKQTDDVSEELLSM